MRGSTSARGAVQAALTLTKHLKAGATAAFTPDGPRGPSHVVQPGAIFLAQKSGSPIIPAGISAHPRKLMRAWDRYMIPWPFARVVWIYGEPIHIPADAKSEEDQRLWAERVGAAITALEEQAEREVGAVRPDGKKNSPVRMGPVASRLEEYVLSVIAEPGRRGPACRRPARLSRSLRGPL